MHVEEANKIYTNGLVFNQFSFELDAERESRGFVNCFFNFYREKKKKEIFYVLNVYLKFDSK